MTVSPTARQDSCRDEHPQVPELRGSTDVRVPAHGALLQPSVLEQPSRLPLRLGSDRCPRPQPPLQFYLDTLGRAPEPSAADEPSPEQDGPEAAAGAAVVDDTPSWLTVAAFVCPNSCADRGAAAAAKSAGATEWCNFRREHATVCWEAVPDRQATRA